MCPWKRTTSLASANGWRRFASCGMMAQTPRSSAVSPRLASVSSSPAGCSGVGWIMEAVLEKFPEISITGLDISENIATRARERLPDPRAGFVVYDGFKFPFEDSSFDVIYSCAVIQHIEKHVAFLLFREIYRSLAVGGHAVLH